MDVTTLIIQLVSGAVGGNVAGLLNRSRTLGPIVNTLLGAIGGVGGGQLLGGNLGDLVGGGTVGTIATSGLVGLVLPLLGSFAKKKSA